MVAVMRVMWYIAQAVVNELLVEQMQLPVRTADDSRVDVRQILLKQAECILGAEAPAAFDNEFETDRLAAVVHQASHLPRVDDAVGHVGFRCARSA